MKSASKRPAKASARNAKRNTAGKKASRSALRPTAKPKPKRKSTPKVAPIKMAVQKKSPSLHKPAAAAMRSPLLEVALRALDDMKAVNVVTLDVRGLTDVADAMVIASGNSDRHVRSIAERVVEFAKKAGFRPMGVEGERDGEWVLVDLQDVIVHVMLPRVREFYRLESLWDVTAARREAAGQ